MLALAVALLRAQHTWLGRLFGIMAIVGYSFGLLQDVLHVLYFVIYHHPSVAHILGAINVPMTILGTIGLFGLGFAIIRYHELDHVFSAAHWLQWPIIGGIIGIATNITIILVVQHWNLIDSLTSLLYFIVIPTWACLTGTAIGIFRTPLQPALVTATSKLSFAGDAASLPPLYSPADAPVPIEQSQTAPVEQPGNTWGLVTLFLGIGSFIGIGVGPILSPVAITVGIIALRKAKNYPPQKSNRSLAIAGITIASISLTFYLGVVALFLLPAFGIH